ncbi:MAG: ABC transporter ATP-binding protein/permease [Clostridiales bacterium]|jgi:ATP-binding cassette subfamily B protein|nr:ABC transporter ATP-binding protein/permease [Clostridiales bacterium]
MKTDGKRFHKLRRFLAYYSNYKNILFLDLFCAFVAAGAALSYPLLVNRITRDAISAAGVDLDVVLRTAAILGALIVVEYACNFYITYQGHVMGAKMEFNMRNDLFAHLQRLSFSYYDNQKTGQLMSRITTDLFDITELAHHGPEDVILSVVKFVGAFVILLSVNWRLTLVIFALVPLMALFALHYSKKMKAAFMRNRQRIADINAQIEDSLSGVRAVKSFANEGVEIEKFRAGNARFVDSKRDSYHTMAKFHTGLGAFVSGINFLVVIAGALFIRGGAFGLPGLITFLLYINLLIEPVRRFINFTEQFQNGATGFERFLEILAVEPDIADAPGAKPLGEVRGEITFHDVGFRYAPGTEPILSNINFTARAGEYVALVGSSGVGKTTLCSLIPRFYDTTEGAVKIDGIDVRAATVRSLRENIGIVQQDVYLFTGNVRDNIRYGKPGATEDEILAAAKNANAHEFIMSLPDGYDTDIGQRGVKLSGGQKQRISIARVFLKNPRILIFDEATSSLDNESERVVQDSFERLAANRTTFVIAHRLSTIRNAERIVVLTSDGIEEEGRHEDLLRRGGAYARLYNMQFKHTEIEPSQVVRASE